MRLQPLLTTHPNFHGSLLVTAMCLIAQPLAIAQPISIGVRGGIHLIDWFKTLEGGPGAQGSDTSSKGAVGPFVSVRLPARLALQVEALRRNYGFKRPAGRLGFFSSHDESGSAGTEGWPMLLSSTAAVR